MIKESFWRNINFIDFKNYKTLVQLKVMLFNK